MYSQFLRFYLSTSDVWDLNLEVNGKIKKTKHSNFEKELLVRFVWAHSFYKLIIILSLVTYNDSSISF